MYRKENPYQQLDVTGRVLVKISGKLNEINFVLKTLIDAFGKEKIVYNYPMIDRRTGIHYIYVNVMEPLKLKNSEQCRQ